MLTAKSLKTMLGKESLTGEQVGRALISGGAFTYSEMQAGRPAKVILTPEDVGLLTSKISAGIETDNYNCYVALSRWTGNVGMAYNARIGEFDGLVAYFRELISSSIFALDVAAYVNKLPRIITEKELKQRKEQAIQKQLDSENEITIFNALEYALNKQAEQHAAGKLQDSTLAALLDEYKKKPIKSNIILDKYNEVNKIGYKQLEDGRRSDEMTAEEWRDAIIKPEYSAEFKKPIEDLDDKTRAKFARLSVEAKYNGEQMKILRPYSFHVSTRKPQGVSKYEILEAGDLLEYYSFEDLEELPYRQAEKILKARFRDFAEEYEAALNHIIQVGKELYNIDFSPYPPEEWGATIKTKDLYESNFFGYRDDTESATNIFEGDLVAAARGVAVLHSIGDYNPTTIGNDGEYVAPKFKPSITDVMGLDRFTSCNPEKEKELQALDEKIRKFENCLYYLNGITEAMKLISKRTKLPEYMVFAPPLDNILEQAKALEGLFKSLYISIEEKDSSTNKAEKLRLLKNRLCDIGSPNLEIEKANYEELKKRINGMRVFRSNLDKISSLVMK